ncbi:MAG: hypothetical protein O7E52_14855 [Candidatus Poribacteria bacterium]|nr:hypothetical protein [Candidatus Poribacteria bacterium]
MVKRNVLTDFDSCAILVLEKFPKNDGWIVVSDRGLSEWLQPTIE